MWKKFQEWWNKLKEERKQKQIMKVETELWEELLECKIVPGSVHVCIGLISSVYFNHDKEFIAVDFSQLEKTGIAHFMIFTMNSPSKYNANDIVNQQGYATTYVPEAIVFMRQFTDGSASWCFR